MRRDLIVSESIIINANPDQVWHALTTPALIKEYLFGTETITDWQVGHTISFRGEYDDKPYEDKGIILKNVPNQLLSYSYWSGFSGLDDEPENYSTVTYILADPEANQTTFTWTQEGFANEAGYQHSLNGMAAFLQQIKEIAER